MKACLPACSHHAIQPYPKIKVLPVSHSMGWQHQATSNTDSPSISALWVNASQATLISLHAFRSCFPRRSLLPRAWNRRVSGRFDTGRGPLYMAIPSELPTAKDRRNILNAKFLQ